MLTLIFKQADFSIYVNDFHKCLNRCSSIMCADDTSVFVQSKSVFNLISMSNADLQNNDTWLASNIRTQIQKTNYIIFQTKNTKSTFGQLTLRNHKIQKMNHIKFLGLTLSENLS